MSANDLPSEVGVIDKFEFELGQSPDNCVYWVVDGGRAAMKTLEGPQEGKYRLAHYGILDPSSISHLLAQATTGLPKTKNHAARVTEYELAQEYLLRCRETARALNEKNVAWGIHIDAILAFYEAVRSQSDQLIDGLKTHHPEFEEYRLPDISEHDKESMRAVARRALRNALENV